LKLDDARDLLASQEDFASAKPWMRELCASRGHLLDFYPKFHCELNWIERMWGYVKRQLRQQCEYKFSTLRDLFPCLLLAVPVDVCRRFYRHALRYTLAYGSGPEGHKLTPEQVQ
jgi:hypothetical protein